MPAEHCNNHMCSTVIIKLMGGWEAVQACYIDIGDSARPRRLSGRQHDISAAPERIADWKSRGYLVEIVYLRPASPQTAQ